MIYTCLLLLYLFSSEVEPDGFLVKRFLLPPNKVLTYLESSVPVDYPVCWLTTYKHSILSC